MAGATNQLVAWTREIAPFHDAREYDVVVASGEQVTSGLLGTGAAADRHQRAFLARAGRYRSTPTARMVPRGSPASTPRPWSSGSARGRWRSSPASRALRPTIASRRSGAAVRILRRSRIAAAIGAERCDIYTDVDGVCTTDPRVVPKAKRLEKVSFEEMLEMASVGAKVLQVRSVELAMTQGVRVLVRSAFDRARRAAGRHCRHPHLRRGRDRGAEDRNRHRLFQGRGADHAAPGRGQAGRCRRRVRPARRRRHQCRHDRPERLGGRHDHRSHFHRADRRK